MSLPALQPRYADWVEAVRRISVTVNAMLQGRSNAVGEVTLQVNESSTAVSDPRVSEDSAIVLMPRTANAAAALATSHIATVSNGSFAIRHANNAQTDRDFRYAIQG